MQEWDALVWSFPRFSFLPFLKMGVMLPFSQSLGILPDSHDFSNMMESALATISVSSPIPGMCVIRSHRLVAVQLHQMILNLLFAYSGKDFTPSTSTQKSGTWSCVLGDISTNSANSHVEPGTIHIIHCPSSNRQFSYDVVGMYAGLASYEKASVGIIRNRKKTESGKKGKGK